MFKRDQMRIFAQVRPRGMGMWLAIGRSVVEDHGGLLWAAQNDGPGATFQFTLLKYRQERL